MAKDAKKTQSEVDNKKKNHENDDIKKKKGNDDKESLVKEKKIKNDNNYEKLDAIMKKIDDNRWTIILFVVGFLLATLLFRCILWPDRIATLKDGTQPVVELDDNTITADDLYADMKKSYSINVLLNLIDAGILEKMYPSTTEMESDVKNSAEYYYSMYEKNYGYTKETFLSQYGFNSDEEFLDSLRLDYRRNSYYDEYVLGLISDKDIEKYYETDVFGDVDSKHILVSVSSSSDDESGLSDEEAKKLANEIIKKLNNGTSWDDVIKEYKDQIVYEELGYNAFNASLESAYLKECKNLKVGTYSQSPVLTSYGYHIVYKIDQKDKPKLKDVKDDIKEVLSNEKKKNDENLYYKALISMRKDAGLKFTDTTFEDAYKEFVEKYEK